MNYLKLYADCLRKFFKTKKKLRVVFDCSNGTTGLVVGLLRHLVIRKLEVVLINEKPDGNFPAHGPNPMLEGAMSDLSRAVKKYRADLGAVFDADGDRVFFVDDRGRPVGPDVPIALMSQATKGPVVLTINIGLLARDLLKKSKRKIIDSRVGHYFIKKIIRGEKIEFAAERSGHYYFKKNFYADSGIFAAIQFINIVSKLKSPLSEWIDQLPKYFSSGELNFEVQDKENAVRRVENHYKSRATKISHLDGLTVEVNGLWFNLRPSNTEDLVRLNLEAKDKKIFTKELETIKELL